MEISAGNSSDFRFQAILHWPTIGTWGSADCGRSYRPDAQSHRSHTLGWPPRATVRREFHRLHDLQMGNRQRMGAAIRRAMSAENIGKFNAASCRCRPLTAGEHGLGLIAQLEPVERTDGNVYVMWP